MHARGVRRVLRKAKNKVDPGSTACVFDYLRRRSKGEVSVPCSPAADAPVLCVRPVPRGRRVLTQRRFVGRMPSRRLDIPATAMPIFPGRIARRSVAMSGSLRHLDRRIIK